MARIVKIFCDHCEADLTEKPRLRLQAEAPLRPMEMRPAFGDDKFYCNFKCAAEALTKLAHLDALEAKDAKV